MRSSSLLSFGSMVTRSSVMSIHLGIEEHITDLHSIYTLRMDDAVKLFVMTEKFVVQFYEESYSILLFPQFQI